MFECLQLLLATFSKRENSTLHKPKLYVCDHLDSRTTSSTFLRSAIKCGLYFLKVSTQPYPFPALAHYHMVLWICIRGLLEAGGASCPPLNWATIRNGLLLLRFWKPNQAVLRPRGFRAYGNIHGSSFPHKAPYLVYLVSGGPIFAW
jgi:hypothetical protein